jgi:ABC-type lipoprotein export system ATPase subunit
MVLLAENLGKRYRKGGTVQTALAGVSVELRPHDFLVLTGVSGSGKSTLLHLLSGLETPSTGRVVYRGQDLAQCSFSALARLRNAAFGFIFQTPHLLAEKSLAENVCLPLQYGTPVSSRQARLCAEQALALVGLEGFGHRFPATLSGGELQRTVFARVLAQDPAVLFADEPTGSLDADNSERILDLLRSQAEQGRCVVLATHDLRLVNSGTAHLHLKKAVGNQE